MFRIHSRVALTLAVLACAGILIACSSSDSTAGTPSPRPSPTLHPSFTPARTASPAPTETDNGLCGATATVSIPTPASAPYAQTVTGVLTCTNGIASAAANMLAVWHEKGGDEMCNAIAVATDTASCTRQIGALTSGYKVVIDVTFELNGSIYATTTSFTPQ